MRVSSSNKYSALVGLLGLLLATLEAEAAAPVVARLRYSLSSSRAPEVLEAQAAGLARHFDWLSAHGYRLRLAGMANSSSTHPPRCGWVELEFVAPSDIQAAVVTPLLRAFGIAAADPITSATTPRSRVTGLLKPESALAELVRAIDPAAPCGEPP